MFDIALMFHLLGAVIWVGGMFFAYFFLRPASSMLSDEDRLSLWSRVLSGFFPIVSVCILVIFVTGFYLIYRLGGFIGLGNYINVMMMLAFIMLFIFKFAYIKPYRALNKNVAQKDWQAAGKALNTIRQCVAINLLLGILTIFVAVALKVW